MVFIGCVQVKKNFFKKQEFLLDFNNLVFGSSPNIFECCWQKSNEEKHI